MRLLFLFLLYPFLLGFFILAAKALDFCFQNESKWWGGFPLWMTVGLGFLLPVFLGGLLMIGMLVLGEF